MLENLSKKQIERIAKKANTKEVKDECEPNVCWQLTVERWMVRRVLNAYDKVVKRER